MDLTQPAEAARLIADSDRLRAQVGATASWRHVSWLVGMAAAMPLYFAALGLAGGRDAGVLAVSAVLGTVVAALCSLLPGARATKVGFPRRWVTSVLAWGVLFAAGITLGLLLFRGDLWFWLVSGLLVAVPLAWGARAEASA